MAERINNARILYGGANISCDMNELTITRSADMLDKTTFCSSARRRLAGLRDIQITGSGFVNYASTVKNDPHIFSQLGSTAEAILVCADSSLGAICFAANHILMNYVPGGAVGEMMKFNFACYGVGDAYRGKLMEAGTGLSTALSATPQNLGSVSSSQTLYGINQVSALSSSGGTHTIRVCVQSANTSGFGSPTTVMKMSAIDWSTRRVSGEIKSTAANTTDDWWRIRIDSSGSSNSKMTGYIALAIQ